MADAAKRRATYEDLMAVPDLSTHGDEEVVQAEPFDAIELDLTSLWGGRQLPSGAQDG